MSHYVGTYACLSTRLNMYTSMHLKVDVHPLGNLEPAAKSHYIITRSDFFFVLQRLYQIFIPPPQFRETAPPKQKVVIILMAN